MLFRHDLPSFLLQPVSGLREVPLSKEWLKVRQDDIRSQGAGPLALSILLTARACTGAAGIFSGPSRMIFNMLFITHLTGSHWIEDFAKQTLVFCSARPKLLTPRVHK